MKNTSIGTVTAVFCIILTILRIPLKLFFIDGTTGFYSTENIFGALYNGIFFIFLALSVFFSIKNKKDFLVPIRVGTVRCVICSLSGIAIAFASFLRLKETFSMEFCDVNCASPFLVYPAHILGIVSGVFLLILSLSFFSGTVSNKIPQLMSLVLPVWCALVSLTDFLSFRFTIYASDQMITTIFMLSSIMFLLYLSKSLIYENSEEKPYLIPASITVISGIPVAAAQISTMVLLDYKVAGPTALQCLVMLSLSAAAFCFILVPARKSQKN